MVCQYQLLGFIIYIVGKLLHSQGLCLILVPEHRLSSKSESVIFVPEEKFHDCLILKFSYHNLFDLFHHLKNFYILQILHVLIEI